MAEQEQTTTEQLDLANMSDDDFKTSLRLKPKSLIPLLLKRVVLQQKLIQLMTMTGAQILPLPM